MEVMTDLQLKRRAVKNYPRLPNITKNTTKHLRREWIKSVKLLGKDWLLLKQPERRDVPYGHHPA